MPDRKPLTSVVWAPWLLAAITLVGLVVALVGGSAWAPASWLALLGPILLGAQRILSRFRRSGRSKASAIP